MNSQKTTHTITFGLATMSVLAITSTLATAQIKGNVLIGSWLCDHIFTSGLTGGTKTLQVFTGDGLAIANGQGDIIPPVLSPQVGAWTLLGGRRYGMTFKSIVYDPSSGIPPGTFLGLATISQKVSLDAFGNALTGTFSFQQADTSGNVVFAAGGTFGCTRITVEPSGD